MRKLWRSPFRARVEEVAKKECIGRRAAKRARSQFLVRLALPNDFRHCPHNLICRNVLAMECDQKTPYPVIAAKQGFV
jgi:hypothetical protein